MSKKFVNNDSQVDKNKLPRVQSLKDALSVEPKVKRQNLLSQQFVDNIRQEMIGFELIDDDYSYEYNVREGGRNTDPFVRKTLKIFDRQLYDEIKGWTKKVDLEIGLKDLEEYNTSDIPNRLDKDVYKSILNKVKALVIPTTKLNKLKIDDAVTELQYSTAAGFSFPGNTKGEVIDKIYNIAQFMKHELKRGLQPYSPSCKLGFRGHLSEIDSQKVRPVWVYPAEITLLESIFVAPLYEHFKQNVQFVFFGEDTLKRICDRLNKDTVYKEVTADWSKFDKNIPSFLINDVFNIIKQCFDTDFKNTFHKDGTVKVNTKDDGWNNVFEYVRNYFINTKVMLPDGTTIIKKKGIPSGSMFTSIVGSLCNYIMISYLCDVQDERNVDLCVLGDDSHFRVRKLNLTKFQEDAHIYFNSTINKKKMKVADPWDPGFYKKRTFLGYNFSGKKLIRPDNEWFKRAIYTEHDVNNVGVSASRVIGLLMIGGCNCERYLQFFDYYIRAYALEGRDIPMSKEISRVFRYSIFTETKITKVPKLSDIDWISLPTFLIDHVSIFDTKR